MVSNERIRYIRDEFAVANTDNDESKLLVDNTCLALDELLAYREGYGPQERLPEPDHQVVVEFTVYKEPVVVDRCLAVFDHEARQWVGNDGGDNWYEPVGWALRWYPIGGE